MASAGMHPNTEQRISGMGSSISLTGDESDDAVKRDNVKMNRNTQCEVEDL